MTDERKCAGYTVIDSIRIGETEIVLAYNPAAPSPYVTWKSYAFTNYQEFAYGKYFGSEEKARENMQTRAKEEQRIMSGSSDRHRKSPPDKKSDRSR